MPKACLFVGNPDEGRPRIRHVVLAFSVSPPLNPGQTLALWLFQPVRPRIRTNDTAWAECGHWDVIGPRVGVQDRPVVAQPAAHVERPHAVGAHVVEGHRRSGLGSWSCAHAGEDTASAGPSESWPGSAAV
jgi:hypothetical protein